MTTKTSLAQDAS